MLCKKHAYKNNTVKLKYKCTRFAKSIPNHKSHMHVTHTLCVHMYVHAHTYTRTHTYPQALKFYKLITWRVAILNVYNTNTIKLYACICYILARKFVSPSYYPTVYMQQNIRGGNFCNFHILDECMCDILTRAQTNLTFNFTPTSMYHCCP